MTGWSEQEADEAGKSVCLWELYSWNYHIWSQETSQRRTKTSGRLANTDMIRVHACTHPQYVAYISSLQNEVPPEPSG